MGLDQYAYTRSGVSLPAKTDFDEQEDDELIFQWRKHPDLHGWMYNLYKTKGGEAFLTEFNLKTVQLTIDDLLNLKRDVENRFLPPTTGFFFGESLQEEDEQTLEFIDKARDLLRDGNCVIYYTSWW